MSRIQIQILAAGLVFVGLISALFAFRAWRHHTEVHAAAVAGLSGQTLALKAFTEESFGRVEDQLRVIAARVRAARSLDIEELRDIGVVFAARQGRPPYLDDIVVADAAGNTLYAARTGTPETYVDRDYFAIHRNHLDSATRFNRVEDSKVADAPPRFSMSRRLETRDGKFAGVIVAYLDVEALAREYERLRAHPEHSLALIAADGTLVTRTPYSRDFVGRTVLFPRRSGDSKRLDGDGDLAVFIRPVALDGVSRLVVQRRLESYPFAAGAAMTERAVYARWRRELPQLTLVWCLFALATIAGGYLLARQAGRASEARETLGRISRDLDFYKDALDQNAILGITDTRGEILYVNDNFCAVSKYAREELVGQDHRILNSGHHPMEFFRDLWRTIARGRVWRGQIRNRAKDGSVFWLDTMIMPLLDGRGRLYRYFAISLDVTPPKRIEAAAEHPEDRP